jgi:hypothetical protein
MISSEASTLSLQGPTYDQPIFNQSQLILIQLILLSSQSSNSCWLIVKEFTLIKFTYQRNKQLEIRKSGNYSHPGFNVLQ